MTELSVELRWQQSGPDLVSGKYSGAHTVRYNDKHELPVDAAPDWGGNPDYTNPEQALAASVASCHMLTFLALASKARWPVTGYQDHAVAHLGKNAKGRMCVTRIDLHPEVEFDSGFSVDPAEMEKMQERAHRFCFVANSLADSVVINIVI